MMKTLNVLVIQLGCCFSLFTVSNMLGFHILLRGSNISTFGPLSGKCFQGEVQMDSVTLRAPAPSELL